MMASHDRWPAWRKLTDQLRARIRSGELEPGDLLPSEMRLVRATGLSRTTVRLAIAQLRFEGLVATQGREGTFVLGALGPVLLSPGDSVTSSAALTLTRANGQRETYPAGTVLRRPTPRKH
jgi:DNA-binding GntR family transcriptional regulator